MKGGDNMVSNLKLVRIARGIKQKDLAQQVGITPQYLMNLENGKAKNPSIRVMKKLSDALECDVQELFFEEISIQNLFSDGKGAAAPKTNRDSEQPIKF